MEIDKQVSVWNSEGAQQALHRGLEALTARDGSQAVRWFDRANRLAPQDAAATLLLASALVGRNFARAGDILTQLVAKHPNALVAKRMLLDVHMHTGAISAATNQLSELLSGAAVPVDNAFRQLADDITKTAGRPGWVGLTQDGTLFLSVSGEVRIDGRRLAVSARQSPKRGLKLALPNRWENAHSISVISAGCHLLGSPIDIHKQVYVEGFVEVMANGDLSGWAWMPGAPDAVPRLTIAPADRSASIREIVASDEDFVPRSSDGISRLRGFHVPRDQLVGCTTIHVLTCAGRDIFGSPVRLGEYEAAARFAAARTAEAHPVIIPKRPSRRATGPDVWRPLPAQSLLFPSNRQSRPPRATAPARPPIDVIMPVYRCVADFLACMGSLRSTLPARTRIVIVDDASSDQALRAAIGEAEESGAIVLRHSRNCGFPTAANTGLRHAASAKDGPRDVVLLNPDTLVPRFWLKRLADAAYAAPDIGSVTPMSNDGSIVSYPTPGVPGPDLDWPALGRLDRMFARMNSGLLVELPTAVGFCMFIRHDCLAETGTFREDCFAQGYGEENDWCFRARHLGWRHVAHGGLIVAHSGGRSFGAVKSDLSARNLATLNRLHPGYDAAIQAFVADDPLRPARQAVDKARWQAGHNPKGSVIVVSHALGGGVERHVRTRVAQLRRNNLRPILLTPTEIATGGQFCCLSDGGEEAYPNLYFDTAKEIAELATFLRPDKPRWLELHHQVGHSQSIADLATVLQIPYDILVHDFAAVCPRITLVGVGKSYCGEPDDIEDCDACVADAGSHLQEEIDTASLRSRSARQMALARRIVAPTLDTANHIRRYVSTGKITVSPWEDDSYLSQAVTQPKPVMDGRTIRICVAGGIGEEKGYHVLLACARDAARRLLPLHFDLFGHSMDDARLIATGQVFVTGKYREEELAALIDDQKPDLGFLPSVFPETWCYALSALWMANLWPVAFNLGAQAERITRTGRGTLLPIGLPPARINDAITQLARGTIFPVSPDRIATPSA